MSGLRSQNARDVGFGVGDRNGSHVSFIPLDTKASDSTLFDAVAIRFPEACNCRQSVGKNDTRQSNKNCSSSHQLPTVGVFEVAPAATLD